MPKRKAPSRLSGLMDSDDEDIMQPIKETQDTHAEPPAKKRRGRPRTSNESGSETKSTKPNTRAKKQQAISLGPEVSAQNKSTRRGRPKGSGSASQNAEPPAPAPAETEEMEADNSAIHNQENENPGTSKSTIKPAKPAKTTKARNATAPKRGREQTRANIARNSRLEDEFEYTPKTARQESVSGDEEAQSDPSPVSRAAARVRQDVAVGETQQTGNPPTEHLEDSVFPEPRRPSMSPQKPRGFRPSLLRNSQGSPMKRKLADSEKGGDPELRRRLGELTKKYDALEIKYRNLREIAIVEANTNMDELRKQNEAITTASNKLVASLTAELDAQRKLGMQSRGLQKQLNDRDSEITRAKADADEARAQLASAQSEAKALQTKLAAARNTAASLEGASKIPGSAIKSGKGPIANRANAAASAEAAQAAQVARLKEDLYSDLTGLIIRDVKNRDSDNVYDCIQTGSNGTLHFHLAVPKDLTDFNNIEFQYLPLLDAHRDRELVDILPDFLTVDITFKRGQAAKFYTRVIDALTKRRSLPG